MLGPTTIARLDALVRRLRPATFALVVFATLVTGAGLTKLVVSAFHDSGTGRPDAAAPLTGTNHLASWDPMLQTPAPLPDGTPIPGPHDRDSPTAAATPPAPIRVPAARHTRSTPTPGPYPVVRLYEAESAINTLAGGAVRLGCPTCSGTWLIGWVGFAGTLQFNAVMSPAAGTATVTIWYVNGDPARAAQLTVDGVPGAWIAFPSTGNWSTAGSVTATIRVVQGANEVVLGNPGGWAPWFDRISVRAPSG